MRIRRHCVERLPGGERLWRKAARMVGFNGTLHVTGQGQKAWNHREIINPKRKLYGVTLGFYLEPNHIWVFLQNSRCARPDKKKMDPLGTFLHELAHFVQYKNGHSFKRGSRKTIRGWKNDPYEREADQFARNLRKKLGV